MIAPANHNYTADEPLIAEACQKRAADITAQADDEADPIEVMPAGEPRPQSKYIPLRLRLRVGPLVSLPQAREPSMMSNKSGLVRLTNRLGFGQIHTMSDSLRREERLRFTAHELHHRNKNLLAVVQAIANQIGSRSLSSKDYQEQFSQRLQGLSRSLDLLVEEDGCGVWMADLVRNQLQPFGEVDGVRVAAMGPAILLQPDAAQNIGLAMHELATNALKHGALSVPEGTIAVHWNLGPDATGRNCFHFTWSECGGPKVVPPPRRGFGHVVLQRMTGPALQRKVKHEFEANGVRWSLEAPAATAVLPVRQNAHLPGGHLSNVPSGANSIRT